MVPWLSLPCGLLAEALKAAGVGEASGCSSLLAQSGCPGQEQTPWPLSRCPCPAGTQPCWVGLPSCVPAARLGSADVRQGVGAAAPPVGAPAPAGALLARLAGNAGPATLEKEEGKALQSFHRTLCPPGLFLRLQQYSHCSGLLSSFSFLSMWFGSDNAATAAGPALPFSKSKIQDTSNFCSTSCDKEKS